jgi:protein tyrosine phosphatase (PTP) superfamily phosphohydrolase (DUF442 family)
MNTTVSQGGDVGNVALATGSVRALLAWLNAQWARMLRLRLRRRKQETALDRLRYSDSISFGKSPTIRDIAMLARKAGFRALLNLNTEGEPRQILSPNVEATWAHTFEMQHERVSINVSVLRSEWVDRFLETLQRIGKPVYVHSLNGRRAAALMIIHLGLERRLSGDEALAEAKTLGLDCALEQLQRFTVSEVDRRTHPSGPTNAKRVAQGSVPARSKIEDGSTDSSERVAPEAC